MEKICANKEHGKKLCLVNCCSAVHGRISMNKPLDFYLKIVVLLKSIVGFI
jgi:hypothetical protein